MNKWERYNDALAILKVRGIKYKTANQGVELIFEDGTQFWPTTGTIMQDGKRLDIKGIDALLEAVVA